MISTSIVLTGASQTRELGIAIAQAIGGTVVIIVSGPLGAGKTTLAQGLASGLGVQETVTSPTFTTMNEYDSGRLPFYHLDLYRLHETRASAGADSGPAGETPVDLDLLAAELDEIMQAPSVVLVEWPEFFSTYFENLDRIEITLQFGGENISGDDQPLTDEAIESARRAVLRGHGRGAESIVEAIRTR